MTEWRKLGPTSSALTIQIKPNLFNCKLDGEWKAIENLQFLLILLRWGFFSDLGYFKY